MRMSVITLIQMCIRDRIFDTKYLIEDSQLYNMFIDDLLNQAETLIKRYLGLRVLMETRNVPRCV